MARWTMDGDKLLGLLGLAQRAGQLAVGARAVEKMVKQGGKPVVVLATDAGDSQRAKLSKLQPVRALVDDVLTGEEMARAMGRQKLVVAGVCDPGFVKGILALVP